MKTIWYYVVCILVISGPLVTISTSSRGNSPEHFLEKIDNGVIIQKCNNDDELDQEQTKDCSYGYFCYYKRWLAQSFKPTFPILTRVQIKLFRQGDPLDSVDITLSIREELTGEDLTIYSLKGSDIIGSDQIWVEFDIPDIEVTPEHTYYIVCRALAATRENCFAWYIGKDEQYPRGGPYESRDAGNTWVDLLNYDYQYENIDLCFRTFGRGIQPFQPETPTGPEEGEIGYNYSYTTLTTDPLGKQLFYLWDWGDETTSDWDGPYDSGETITETHSWDKRGVYLVKVKAKNSDEIESQWSDPIIVGIPVKSNEVDQKQEDMNDDKIGYGTYPGRMLAQSFIPTQNTLTRVELRMFRKDNPNKITISIRETVDGDDLTSVEITGTSIPTKISWVQFDFTDIEVVPGQPYYIIWNPDIPNITNNFYWLFDVNDPYLQGEAWSGLPWKILNEFQYPHPDFCFKTYFANTKHQQFDDVDVFHMNPFNSSHVKIMIRFFQRFLDNPLHYSP
jgi:hypothetical protein